MPEMNTFKISYDAVRKRLVFAGHTPLKVRTGKVLKGHEMAPVDCYIEPGNPLDWRLPSSFTIGTEGSSPEDDLYVRPMLVTGYKAGDTIKVPSDIDLKTLTPSDMKGTTQEAKNPIALSAIEIGVGLTYQPLGPLGTPWLPWEPVGWSMDSGL